MKLAVIWVAVLAPALVPAIGHADKLYNGGRGATWDCKKDPVVLINHGRGTYTFEGPCKTIQLNGAQSTLTIESVDQIHVNGANNTITLGEVDQINVVGANNSVTWRKAKHGDKPGVNVVGANNKIEGNAGGAADKPVARAGDDKPAGKKPRDRNAIDCAQQPSQVIDTGDNTLVYVGACEQIVVNGGENHLTIESVRQLTINGAENVVDVGAADTISIEGQDNKVSYKKGLSGAKPRVTSLGERNTVTKK